MIVKSEDPVRLCCARLVKLGELSTDRTSSPALAFSEILPPEGRCYQTSPPLFLTRLQLRIEDPQPMLKRILVQNTIEVFEQER